MQLIPYESVTAEYRESGYTISNCNSILFINTGQISVQVDQVNLQPGQSLAIDGNVGEINVKQYSFIFPPVTSVFKSLTVVRKLYVDKKLQEDVFKGLQKSGRL